LVFLKGLHVDVLAVEGTTLAGERLDEHADGHSGRKGVRIDDDVWRDATLGERHVFLRPDDAHHTFLSMS